jgi:hypothetical protein
VADPLAYAAATEWVRGIATRYAGSVTAGRNLLRAAVRVVTSDTVALLGTTPQLVGVHATVRLGPATIEWERRPAARPVLLDIEGPVFEQLGDDDLDAYETAIRTGSVLDLLAIPAVSAAPCDLVVSFIPPVPDYTLWFPTFRDFLDAVEDPVGSSLAGMVTGDATVLWLGDATAPFDVGALRIGAVGTKPGGQQPVSLADIDLPATSWAAHLAVGLGAAAWSTLANDRLVRTDGTVEFNFVGYGTASRVWHPSPTEARASWDGIRRLIAFAEERGRDGLHSVQQAATLVVTDGDPWPAVADRVLANAKFLVGLRGKERLAEGSRAILQVRDTIAAAGREARAAALGAANQARDRMFTAVLAVVGVIIARSADSLDPLPAAGLLALAGAVVVGVTVYAVKAELPAVRSAAESAKKDAALTSLILPEEEIEGLIARSSLADLAADIDDRRDQTVTVCVAASVLIAIVAAIILLAG